MKKIANVTMFLVISLMNYKIVAMHNHLHYKVIAKLLRLV